MPGAKTAEEPLNDTEMELAQHYDTPDDLPAPLRKYWSQRYSLFSLYDDGILMTPTAFFSVTPEPVANAIADHISQSAPAHKTTIIDAFAGVGGNTIAFALSDRWERVFAIEKDPETLKAAKANAAIYGVEKKIWWIQGDAFDVVQKRFSKNNDAVVFASPPWGGPGYREDEVFNLTTMKPYSLSKLYTGLSKVSPEAVIYLPRSSDLNQLAKYARDGPKTEVIHYCMRGASKALCIFYGEFLFLQQS